LRIVVADDAAAAARRAADIVVAACRTAVHERSRAVIALSGGATPWPLFELLSVADMPWPSVFIAQVDERIAPAADPRRNLRRIQEIFVEQGSLPRSNLLAMPVIGVRAEVAAATYQWTLESVAGAPLRLDLVQLGLGPDGHTASLLPGDAVLSVRNRDVALSGPYDGLRRMTLTAPALNRARARVWLVTGPGKQEALEQLVQGNGDTPAVTIAREESTLVTEASALSPALAQLLRQRC
jgi:6-phosphogluconolactonase